MPGQPQRSDRRSADRPGRGRKKLLPRLGKSIQSLPDDARIWSQPVEGTDLLINLVIDYPSRMIYDRQTRS